MYNCLNVLYLAIFSKTGVTYFRFPSPALKNDSAEKPSHFCFQACLKTGSPAKPCVCD